MVMYDLLELFMRWRKWNTKIIKRVLLAEAQHRRQHSAFESGRWGKIKCTGKKNEKKKEKNQEKNSVTRVDTIGDAAELLSPNDACL